jgi:hypothetical protein
VISTSETIFRLFLLLVFGFGFFSEGPAMLGASGTAKEKGTAAVKNAGRCFLPMMWGEPEP